MHRQLKYKLNSRQTICKNKIIKFTRNMAGWELIRSQLCSNGKLVQHAMIRVQLLSSLMTFSAVMNFIRIAAFLISYNPVHQQARYVFGSSCSISIGYSPISLSAGVYFQFSCVTSFSNSWRSFNRSSCNSENSIYTSLYTSPKITKRKKFQT